MELKTEYYTEDYEPKVGFYAYYVDDSNIELMRHILTNWIKQRQVMPSQYKENVEAFDYYTSKLPVLMYFCHQYATYSPDPEYSHAVMNHYTIIKLQRHELIKIE